jgi:hypothetical protein
MGSKTTSLCREPTDALRHRDPKRLSCDLVRYAAAAEASLGEDFRDVLVGLAPYFDCALRLGLDPVELFESAAASAGKELRQTMITFSRRTDVTLQAFGWRLVEAPDGPCYRPDLP